MAWAVHGARVDPSLAAWCVSHDGTGCEYLHLQVMALWLGVAVWCNDRLLVLGGLC